MAISEKKIREALAKGDVSELLTEPGPKLLAPVERFERESPPPLASGVDAVTISVRLPAALVHLYDALAARDNTSRDALINVALFRDLVRRSGRAS